MKKLRLLSVVCVITLFLTNSLIFGVEAGKIANSITPNQSEEIIIYALPYDFDEYSAYTANSYATAQWVGAVYASLLKRSSANNRGWVGDLAETMPSISEDALTFTFELREDLYFSNGEPLTVEDIDFSLKVAVTPDINMAGYFLYNDYLDNNSMTIISSSKVSFKLLKQSSFPYNLFKFPIIPQETFGERYGNCLDGVVADCIWDSEDGSDAVGAGPFEVTSIDNINEIVTVEKNPYYYNAAFLRVDKFIFQKIAEKNAAIKALADGSIHIMDSQYVPGLTELDGIDGITEAFVADTATQEISINHKHPWFGTGESINQMNGKTGTNYTDAKLLRRAMSHVMPRNEYVNEIMDALAQPAATNMPSASLGWDPEIKPDEYNIETARNIMESIGFNFTNLGQPDPENDQYSNFFFNITVLSPIITSPRGHWGVDYVEQLPKIGIGVTEHVSLGWVEILPRTFRSEIDPPLYDEGGYDLFFVGYSWSLDWNPSGLFEASGSCSTGSCDNFYNFDLEETITPLADAVRDYLTELDYDIKLEKVSYVQELVHEWLPILPILYPQSHWGWSSDITGIDSLLIGQSSQEWDQIYRIGYECNNCEPPTNDHDEESDKLILPLSLLSILFGLITAITIKKSTRKRNFK